MYIRSSIITILLAATLLKNNQVEAFSPTDFAQFTQILSGGGASPQGESSPQTGNQLPNDVSKLVTDTLGGSANPDLEKRFADKDNTPSSGSGVVMASGNEQSTLDYLTGGVNPLSGATIIKRGGEDKMNNNKKNKKHHKGKMKKMSREAPATMPTSLRRRNFLGGGGGGLGGLTGMLNGDSGNGDTSGSAPGGFNMALIGKRGGLPANLGDSLSGNLGGGNAGNGPTNIVNKLLDNGKLIPATGSLPGGILNRRNSPGANNGGLIQQVTDTLKLSQDPSKGGSGFTKNSGVNIGGTELPLARRQDVGDLRLDQLLSGLDGLNDASSSTTSQEPSYSPSGVNNAPQIKVLDNVLGGGDSPSSPMGSYDNSKLSTGLSEGGVNNSPSITILKTKRSLNSLSGADRMARARQGVIVDSEDNQSQETMKRDNYPTYDQQQSSSPQNMAPPPPNPQQFGSDYMYTQPPSNGDKLSSDPSSNSDSSNKNGKKKGGGFKMSLIALPIRRRQQLGDLTNGGKPGDMVTNLVTGLTNGLNLGNSKSEKHTVTEIKQTSPEKSTTYSSNGSGDITQDAQMGVPYEDDTQSDSTYEDDTQSDPTYGDDTQSDPTYGDDTQSDPTYGDDTQSDPTYGDDTQSDPTYGDDSQYDPTYDENDMPQDGSDMPQDGSDMPMDQY